ncbi:uncharacterized protein LOC132631527 isoform X1 [Lycium barbarum]|uniref:uncharacterized protein LOC132631527 isoform X1 n=1 Tax=Lycium barbarum TaxID=112863 RepID=UPI00293EBAAA|nr:uncharacterized protein LOC132631527 isoform X1 [Lycium barbarum]
MCSYKITPLQADFYSCPALHHSMAFFFFIITLSFSLQIQAKDSQFTTTNVYHELDQNSPIKNLIPNSKYLPKVTNFVEPSGNNDYYYTNNNQQQMDKGYTTTSTSTSNPTNTKDYPYKNGGKSHDYNNRYMLSEEHENFRTYHGNEDDYNDEEEPHMP